MLVNDNLRLSSTRRSAPPSPQPPPARRRMPEPLRQILPKGAARKHLVEGEKHTRVRKICAAFGKTLKLSRFSRYLIYSDVSRQFKSRADGAQIIPVTTRGQLPWDR